MVGKDARVQHVWVGHYDLASLPNTCSILHLSVTIVAAKDSVQSLLEASL
jgi:hypothetical protein